MALVEFTVISLIIPCFSWYHTWGSAYPSEILVNNNRKLLVQKLERWKVYRQTSNEIFAQDQCWYCNYDRIEILIMHCWFICLSAIFHSLAILFTLFYTDNGTDLLGLLSWYWIHFWSPTNRSVVYLSAVFILGLIDESETPQEAALRELKEETGFVGTVKHCSPGNRRNTLWITVK